MKTTLRPRTTQPSHIPCWSDSVIQSVMTDLAIAGFVCMQGVISSQLLSKLRLEAFHKKKDSRPVYGTSPHQYRAHLSGLGKAGFTFLAGRSMSELLNILFRMPLSLEKDASCYTYYQPGDYLGPHLDHAEQCTTTAILYLDVVYPDQRSDRTGLELHILDDSPSDEGQTRAVLPTKAGALVLGLGSVNWHKRPTLQNGEYLTALTACYSSPLSA